MLKSIKPLLAAAFGLAVCVSAMPAASQIAPAAAPQTEDAAAQPTTELGAAALADILRDDAARAALIAELERLAGETPAAGETVDPATAAPAADAEAGAAAADAGAEPLTFGGRLAAETRRGAEAAADWAAQVWTRLANADVLLRGVGDALDPDVLLDALRALALVVGVTYAAHFLFRLAGRRFDRAIAATAPRSWVGRAWRATVSAAVDSLVVMAAWAAGYALMVALVGEFGRIGLRQSLFLNAFVVVELSKVALRFVLSPYTPGLRLMRLEDKAALRLYKGARGMSAALGYGHLLFAPIAAQSVSYLAGRSVGAAASLIAVMIAIALVLRSRRAVARALAGGDSGAAGARAGLARYWHWPVVVYLVFLFVIVIARPGGVLLPVLTATGQILLAIIAGAMASQALGAAIAAGVTVPSNVSSRLPLLERRLNAFTPLALRALRILVVLAVVVFSLHAIGALDARAALESGVGAAAAEALIAVFLIFLAAFLVWLTLSSWIDYRLNPDFGGAPTARQTTLLTLLRNAATIAIVVFAGMFALSEIGIDIAPLIASAGVIGLAIGFGAQKLVQDIITGVFIQFENAINVGDVISVAGTTGVVERLTIRSVSLRDVHGVFHIIPFSSVDMVSNFMRGFAYAVCDMGVAYRENLEEARAAMEDAFRQLKADPEHGAVILGDFEWFGVTEFGADAVVLRARIKTLPGKQWAVDRAYKGLLKTVFDERGIEIPFPHRTIYFGEDRDGAAPPLRFAPASGAAPEAKAEEEAKAEAEAERDENAESDKGRAPPGA